MKSNPTHSRSFLLSASKRALSVLPNKLVPIFTLALLFTFCLQSRSQENNASIAGTVTDATGAVIPGATVQSKNTGTLAVRTSKSDAQGEFIVDLLGPGEYQITVNAPGFQAVQINHVILGTGDHMRVAPKLAVGAATSTVEVAANETALLQTESTTVGGTVTPQAIQNLPTNARNVMNLVQLTPGVTVGNQNSAASGNTINDRRLGSDVSANGQATQINNFLLDGMDNNERIISAIVVRPSIDALEEVRVDTSTFPAQFGRIGGAVIQMITKSGTNKYHGSLFEFLRNDMFDAKDFFNVPQIGNLLAGTKPEYRQNDFGGSLGGKIIRDKTFFFGDYEGLRIIQGITYSSPIPTACELGRAACNGVTQLGNFSDMSTPIYSPVTLAPYPNNIIPLGNINGIAANYAALFPTLPESACNGTICNYIDSPNRTQFQDSVDGRIDQQWSSSDMTFGRYSINNTNTDYPSAFPNVNVAGIDVSPGGFASTNLYGGPTHQRTQSIAVGHTHIFTPTVLLRLGAGVSRYVGLSSTPNAANNVNDAFGGPVNANSTVPGTSGLALAEFGGAYGNLGDSRSLPNDSWDTTYNYMGTLSWIRGNQSIEAGGALVRRDYTGLSQPFKLAIIFSATETNSTEGGKGGAGGNAFASMLAGYPHQEQRIVSLGAQQWRAWENGVFVQDDWRATHTLTLNLGLRYDVFTPTTEKHNRLSNFDPTNASELLGGQVVVAGTPGVSSSVNIKTQFGDIQPRLGFAKTFHGTFVVRGGFGTSYFPENYNGSANLLNQPFVNNFTLSQTPGGGAGLMNLSNPLPLDTGLSTCLVAACGAAPTSSLPSLAVSSATATNLKWTRHAMFNLFLEKERGGNLLTVGYVGELGRHLGRQVTNYDEPLPPLGPGGCGVTTAIKLPNPCQPFYSVLPLVSSITLFATNGQSSYNGLQAMFQRRYSKGLTISANYTWSKALDDALGSSGQCSGCGLIYNNPKYDYGVSDYDSKSVIAITGLYDLPFGANLHGLSGEVLKGWTLSSIYAYSSGQPFTVLSSVPQINIGSSSDKPNMVAGSPSFKGSVQEWFDTTQFQAQTFGTAGNESRNPFTGPPFRHFDLSLLKVVPIRESLKLQLRAESFNLTNTPSWGLPNASISGYSGGIPTAAGNFGAITSSNVYYNPRQLQFAAKLLF